MLTITVPGEELFDEKLQQFTEGEGFVLELEHSLVSLSKWESKWEKPFLGPSEKTLEETLGYIEAMTLTPNTPPEIFTKLSKENLEQINAYLNAAMTGTTFRDLPGAKNREIFSAELIYYWLATLNIPFESVENWHLNRLFTLIKVFDRKNSKPTKQSRAEWAAQQRELNAKRRAELGTKG